MTDIGDGNYVTFASCMKQFPTLLVQHGDGVGQSWPLTPDKASFLLWRLFLRFLIFWEMRAETLTVLPHCSIAHPPFPSSVQLLRVSSSVWEHYHRIYELRRSTVRHRRIWLNYCHSPVSGFFFFFLRQSISTDFNLIAWQRSQVEFCPSPPVFMFY